MIAFDIETGPADEATIIKFNPFKEPPRPNPVFDPASVKVGNMKDQVKINEKIESARATHAKLIENFAAEVETQRKAHVAAAIEGAALNAATCQILAVGYQSLANGKVLISTKSEDELCAEFWKRYEDCRKTKRSLVGHNSTEFDIPILMRRSWILGVQVPRSIMEKQRWLDPLIGDTMKVWLAGTRQSYISLDMLSELLGGPRKPEGITGQFFHQFFLSDEDSDREKAIEYLRNDLAMTMHCAVALGFTA